LAQLLEFVFQLNVKKLMFISFRKGQNFLYLSTGVENILYFQRLQKERFSIRHFLETL